MSDKSTIEWTDATWNPVRGCTRISPGCGGASGVGGCYAEVMAARFSDPGYWGHGFARRGQNGGRWTGKVALIPEKLELPIRWKKGRRIFVNSTSDLFHEKLANEEIAAVFGVMAACHQHTFQVLTKRAERLPQWFAWFEDYASSKDGFGHVVEHQRCLFAIRHLAYQKMVPDNNRKFTLGCAERWPLPNVHVGVSVESADYKFRIDHLRAIPAAARFVSYEPALGPLGPLNLDGIAQVIMGGESGPGARPCNVEWLRSAVAECRRAGVAVFVKQLGAYPVDNSRRSSFTIGTDHVHMTHSRKGGDPDEWPEDLRVREFPR
jgi:protein gp37